MGIFFGAEEEEEETPVEESPAVAEDDEVTELSLEEDSEDDGESRADKKKRRGENLIHQQNEELSTLRERLARAEGALGTIQHQFARPTQQGPDPLQEAIDSTYDAEESLRREAAAMEQRARAERRELNQEEVAHLRRRGREVDQQRLQLSARKAMRDEGIRRTDPAEAMQAAIQAEYRDVYADNRARLYAVATYNQRLALGDQDSRGLLENVMRETRQKFGLRPTATEKSKYAGVGGKSGGASEGPRRFQITPEIRMIALQAKSHMVRKDGTPASDSEKIKAWADENRRDLASMSDDRRESA